MSVSRCQSQTSDYTRVISNMVNINHIDSIVHMIHIVICRCKYTTCYDLNAAHLLIVFWILRVGSGVDAPNLGVYIVGWRVSINTTTIIDVKQCFEDISICTNMTFNNKNGNGENCRPFDFGGTAGSRSYLF